MELLVERSACRRGVLLLRACGLSHCRLYAQWRYASFCIRKIFPADLVGKRSRSLSSPDGSFMDFEEFGASPMVLDASVRELSPEEAEGVVKEIVKTMPEISSLWVAFRIKSA